jgi:glycosyltransferase involved in cell wall biosynthesis
MKRVALFCPSLRGGGVERVMLNLSIAFADLGFAVDLVLAKAEGPYVNDVPAKVRIIDLRSKRVISSLPRLVQYLREAGPDVMISAMDHANVVAIMAKKFAGVDTKIHVSTHTLLVYSSANSIDYRQRAVLFFVRWTYPLADEIICVSNAVREDLVSITNLPMERMRVIYNPVPIADLRNMSTSPVDHPWFVPSGVPVILGVGRLVPEKDFSTLIQAMSLIKPIRPVKLIILGEGRERLELENLIQRLDLIEDVALPGFTKNPYAYMSRASVLALTSIWEGLGLVLIEAMACGTPVVSTDCPGGPAEILEHGKFGDLVPICDPEKLAVAILDTIESPKPSDLLCRRANDFSLEKIVDQYLTLLCGEHDK